MTDNSTKDVYSDPLFSIPSFNVCLLNSVHDVSRLHFIENCNPKWVVFKEYTYLAHYKFTTEEGLIRAWVSLKSNKPFTEEEKASVYQRISESRTNLLHAVKEYRNNKAKEYRNAEALAEKSKATPSNSFDDLVTKLALETKTSRAEVLQKAVNLYSAILKCRNNFEELKSNKRWDQWCAENPGAQECKMYDV